MKDENGYIESNDYSEIFVVDGKEYYVERSYWHPHGDTIASIEIFDRDQSEHVTHVEYDMVNGDKEFDPDAGESPEAYTDWDLYEQFIIEEIREFERKKHA